MDADRLASLLGDSLFSAVSVVAETGSTNADLVARSREGAPQGSVLVADHQTDGRGRLDRTWEAPPGSSLLVSILTRPTEPPASLPIAQLHLISSAVGVAAAEAVRAATGAPVGLKWPNDLVVEAAGGGLRKLSGILAESVLAGDRVTALIVGIGINVNWPEALPAELVDIATSCNHLVGADVDREALLADLLVRLGAWYEGLGAEAGRAALRARYRELSVTIGRRVGVELAGEHVEGVVVAVDDDGHLLLRIDGTDGLRTIVAGDVVHARHAAP